MKIFSTYKVKIKHYNHIFRETVDIYRHAVDYLICSVQSVSGLPVAVSTCLIRTLAHRIHKEQAFAFLPPKPAPVTTAE